MDIFAHGLWSVAAYKAASRAPRQPKKLWLAALFGTAPDLLAFLPLLLQTVIIHHSIRPDFIGEEGRLLATAVPEYVYMLYNVSHSLVVFLAAFGLVWLIRKKPLWEMGAWGLHILIDIPTHTSEFFPTPFLWPLSSFKTSGIAWADLRFQILNYGALIVAFLFLCRKPKNPPSPVV